MWGLSETGTPELGTQTLPLGGLKGLTETTSCADSTGPTAATHSHSNHSRGSAERLTPRIIALSLRKRGSGSVWDIPPPNMIGPRRSGPAHRKVLTGGRARGRGLARGGSRAPGPERHVV